MPSISVTLPYVSDLTANHYLGKRKDGRPFVKRHVAQWKLALIIAIRAALDGTMLGEQSLWVRVDWQGPQPVDPDGKAKVIHDAIQAATLINDRHYIIEAGTYTRVPAKQAEITVTVRWA